MDHAASLMLRGIDPHHHLRTADAVEVEVTSRALQRATDLREQEIQYEAELTARLTIQRLADALPKS